jgi:hypothetical protein
MPIDPSIVGGLQQPKFESPVNALAQMLQVQGAQQQNQMGAAKLDEYSRGVARQNKLRDLVSGLGGDATDDQRINAMKTGGYFDEADKLQTGMLARQKTGAEVAKDNAAADKGKNDIAIKRTEMIGQTLGSLQGVQGIQPQHVATALQHLADIGVVSPEQTQQAIAGIPQNPADIPAYLQQHKMAVMSSLDQMKYTTPDSNTALTAKTSADNNRATVAQAERSSIRAAGTAAAGQAQAERHFNATPKGVIVQTESGPMLADPRTGAAMPITENGQPVGSKLKPIPASVNTAIIANSQSLTQLDKTIALLEGQSVAGQVGDTSATGVKGYLPQQMLNAIDPKGIDARAGVADIGSLKLHDRSGAAVTASESPRLMPFIPTATDSNETALKKLRRLKQEVQSESAAMGDTYSKEQGYKPNPILARTSAAAPAAAAKPSLDDIFGKK